MNVQGLSRQSIASHLQVRDYPGPSYLFVPPDSPASPISKQSHRTTQKLYNSIHILEENEKEFLERRHSIAAISQLQSGTVKLPATAERHSFSYASNFFDDQLSNMDNDANNKNSDHDHDQDYDEYDTYAQCQSQQQQQQQQQLRDQYTVYNDEDIVIKSNQSKELELDHQQVAVEERVAKNSSGTPQKKHQHSQSHRRSSTSKKSKSESTEQRRTKFLFQQRLLEIYNQTRQSSAQSPDDQDYDRDDELPVTNTTTRTPLNTSSPYDSVSSPNNSITINFEPFSPSNGGNMMTFVLPQHATDFYSQEEEESLYEIPDNQHIENLLLRHTPSSAGSSSAVSSNATRPMSHQQQAHQQAGISNGHHHLHYHNQPRNLPYGAAIYHPSMMYSASNHQAFLHPPPQVVYHNCYKDVWATEGVPHRVGHYSVSPSPPPATSGGCLAEQTQADPYFPKHF
eukprot:TRINITY_DN2206_c0_g1_i1.p1 TRINITY_DN2206_c0_g1~~TRINITY_DN2206_c0_g1_i1.p1  ORF type:complete len:455 (+),score=109.92 TRINITY_DN2206_c0_g1_i1:154-1518(+)